MFRNLRSLISGTDRLGAERKEGERLLQASDYAGAELHLAEAIVESERAHESIRKRITLRLELAEAQRGQFLAGANPRKLSDAKETVGLAQELALRAAEQDLLAESLDALSDIAADCGEFEKAAEIIQEAGRLDAKLKHRDPLAAARRLYRLALLRQKQGQLGEAAALLAESAATHSQVLGESHSETAHLLSTLGAAQHALGNHREAQSNLSRAIKIHERVNGLDSPEAAADLQLLAASLEESGNIVGASAQFERVLNLKLRAVGLNQNTIADAQCELAHRYIGWRRYARGRELLMEAVGSYKRTGGAGLARGYEAVAELEEDSGHYHDALRELARAGKVWESVKSNHTAELCRNLEHRAFIFDLLRQPQDAAQLRDQLLALGSESHATAS